MSDRRKFIVSSRRKAEKPTGSKRLVMWLHRTSRSSWWAEEMVYAESAEAAAQSVARRTDIEKHTDYRDGHRMKMRVYTLPEEYDEFEVSPTINVEAKGTGADV